MSCNNGLRYSVCRSAQSAYNNATQTFTTTGGTIAVLGTQVCDTGCAVDTTANGFTVKREGVYRASYDIVFEGTGAGTAVFQMYSGTAALPCAYSQVTVAADGVYPVHIETTIPVRACYGNQPAIAVSVTGASGSVTHVCASVVKIA